MNESDYYDDDNLRKDAVLNKKRAKPEPTEPEAELKLNFGGDTLGRSPQKIGGYLEITLNYPRTASFLRMDSVEQKNLYRKIWSSIRTVCVGFGDHTDDYTFEYCRSGQIHLHGYLPVYDKYFIEGIISDVVKKFLNGLPKKYNKFNENNMFDNFHRYRCPSILVQHDNLNDVNETKRFHKWKLYMYKMQ